MTTRANRNDFEQLKGITPKLVRFFEDLFATGDANSQAIEGQVAATGSIQNATVLVLSSNAAFNNERILSLDPNYFDVSDDGPGGNYTVTLVSVIQVNGGYACAFNLEADTNLDLPTSGRVATSDLSDFADDTAAAAGGVPVGNFYRTGSVVKVRVT